MKKRNFFLCFKLNTWCQSAVTYSRYDVQYGDIDYMERQLDFTVDSEAYNGLSQFVDTMRNDYNMRYVIILVSHFQVISDCLIVDLVKFYILTLI